MKVQHETEDQRGLFFIEKEKKRIARMFYNKPTAKLIVIEHTEVDDVQKGNGIGKQLIEAAVDFARKKEVRIVPFCPYAKKILTETEAFKDVL